MKNLVTRRILILMSFAIVTTSILIAMLSFYLSEDIFSFLMGQELVPDLKVLAQLSEHYMDGSVSDEAYMDILQDSEDNNLYVVYDYNGEIIYRSESFYEEAFDETDKLLKDVMSNRRTYKRLEISGLEQVELAGIPIKREGEVLGAVFVAAELSGLTEVRRDFIRNLSVAILIVMAFVNVIANYALRRIIKPIRNIMKVALAMTEGDFSIRADETLKGEIGYIGRTLNLLSRNLYRNVSQLYIEKNRLDHVLNSLEEGMVAIDEKFRVTHVNEVLGDMFDLPDSDPGDMTVQEVPLIGTIRPWLDQVLREGRSVDEQLYVGDTIYRIFSEAIQDERGSVVGAVILYRDVTETVNLDNTRKNYVANVSHELRSPLTSVRGLIEPLMDGIVKEEGDRQRYYSIIYQESLRLSRLVDDIMELSRLQTSDAVIHRSQIDLEAILNMVYERYRHVDETIRFRYEPQPLPLVMSNEDRVEQVLVILLDNAFKFTEPGGTITLSTSLWEDRVLVTVKDTGMGIDKEDLPYIFDRFYKSDKSRTKKSTGLGLSIAKEILGIMGETVTCVSEVDEGSAFTFSATKA